MLILSVGPRRRRQHLAFFAPVEISMRFYLEAQMWPSLASRRGYFALRRGALGVRTSVKAKVTGNGRGNARPRPGLPRLCKSSWLRPEQADFLESKCWPHGRPRPHRRRRNG